MQMDKVIQTAALEHAQQTYVHYACQPITKRAAYGLAVHALMLLLVVDAPTACLLFGEPKEPTA